VAQASRAEAGCINYRLYEDTETANDFVFIEEWESEAALQAHFTTAHVAELMRTLPETVVAPPEVSFHTVERTRDLTTVTRR
jgi:quinol monooxygenase YgiN